MDWIDTLNAVIDSGGVEILLGAVGLPAAAAGVGIYRRLRKTKKLTE